MKLIVGLGNPGPEYRETRHNVGFWVVDAFAHRHGVRWFRRGPLELGEGTHEGKPFMLAKPQQFMNLSGGPVSFLLRSTEATLSDLVVIYDDLDLEIGQIRIRGKGGSGGQRGMRSIINALGSDDFIRIRLGIGRDKGVDPADYVLRAFPSADRLKMEEAIGRATEALELIVAGRLSEAMQSFNREA